MNKLSLFFLLSLSFILIISFLSFPIVNATNYEWIQNASFENIGTTQTEYIYLFPDGFQYITQEWNNYTSILYWINVFGDNTGLYATQLGKTHEHWTFQNLPTDIDISSIDNVTIICEGRNAVEGLASNGVVIYYQPETSWVSLTNFGFNYAYWVNGTWNITEELNSEALINNFIMKISKMGDSTTTYISAICLKVGLTFISEEQENWNSYDLSGYAGFTDAEAHTGSKSGYIIRKTGHEGAGLYQNIPYLSTDNITEVSLYAKTNSVSNTTVNVYLQFSGSGQGQGSLLHFIDLWINSTSAWTKFDYDLLYINDGKIVVSIVIQIYGGDENSYIYIDDVSLKSTVAYGISRFSWYTVPSPVQFTNNDFMGLTYQDYVFYCTIYDFNGNPTEEGIFTATITTGNLIIGNEGAITNGEFYFTVKERNNAFELQTEYLIINTITPSGSYTFYIYVTWYFNTLVTPLPIPTQEGGSSLSYESTTLVNWILMFVVIFLPALLFAGGLYENNKEPDAMHISPVFGLIAGLILSVGLGFYTGLVPLWILIIMIVSVAILIIGAFEHH